MNDIPNINTIKPHEFRKPATHKSVKKASRSHKKYLTVSLVLFILAFLFWSGYTTVSYFANYSWKWQSPILIHVQAPLLIKHTNVTIVSPVSSRSASLVGQVYAETPKDPKAILKEKVVKKWGEDQWLAMDYVVSHESGYNTKAVNTESGACGMGQALPCSKLINKCPDFNDANCQAQWVVDYVANRYQTPFVAMIHEIQENWY